MTLAFRWFESNYPSQKYESESFRIFYLCPQDTTSFAWHTQHHLSLGSTSFRHKADTNERGCTFGANDVMLRINDVALRANDVGLRPMMLRLTAQTESNKAVSDETALLFLMNNEK